MRSVWAGAIYLLRPEGAESLYLPHRQCGTDIRIFPDVSRLAVIFSATSPPSIRGIETDSKAFPHIERQGRLI
jgi:hypothetical protein